MTAPELLPCPFCGGRSEVIMPHNGSRPYVMCVGNFCTAPKETAAAAIAAWNTRADIAPTWRSIDSAPKDGTHILVFYDHDADTYYCPEDGNLTDYAVWSEGGDFLDGRGFCIARWFPQHWESVDKYGGGYFMPAFWFALEKDDFYRVVNPTHWMPLPQPPEDTK